MPIRVKVCVLKYCSPMNTQGKNFVYEICVLFTRHKIHKRNFCLVYSWVNNTLVTLETLQRIKFLQKTHLQIQSAFFFIKMTFKRCALKISVRTVSNENGFYKAFKNDF